MNKIILTVNPIKNENFTVLCDIYVVMETLVVFLCFDGWGLSKQTVIFQPYIVKIVCKNTYVYYFQIIKSLATLYPGVY